MAYSMKRRGKMNHNSLILLSVMAICMLSSCSTEKARLHQNTDFESDSNPGSTQDPSPSDSESAGSTDKIFENTGICGESGEGSVTLDSFIVYQYSYLIGDEGDGEDICRVRFTVRNIGVPNVPCNHCEWSFTVEKSEPFVIADVADGCAESALQLSAEKKDAETISRFSIGYATEDTGHAHVLLHLNETTGIWEAVSVASWNEETGLFFYDRKDGFCGY